ncbi:MAG: transposase [Candidatus Binatia bacterium]
MHKTSRGQEKQGELLSIIAGLEPGAIQAVLLERAKQAALTMAVALLEQDAEALCGQRYERKSAGLGDRGGHEQTAVVVEGARYAVQRPRVRKENRELALPTLAKLQSQDLLDDQLHQRMMLGVSTRNYDQVIDGYSEKLGVSRSSVSRAFVRASQHDLDSIHEGQLDQQSFVALLIDGVEIGGRTVVAALGITPAMEKIPVGLREGDTENSEVVKDLLASLQARGFRLHCERLLAVIDGAKALKKALRAAFGERVVVARCWLHKERNLRGYLPERVHGTLHWRLKKLMALNSLTDARTELAALCEWVAGLSAQAAASLDEVGEELLTLHGLGITGELRKSLSSTNLIESLFSVVRDKLHRVKNWRAQRSNQILRWVAASIRAHRKKMRRVRGLAQAEELVTALGRREVAAQAA